MKILFNGEVIGTVLTNHSMTIYEAVALAFDIDIDSQEDLERLYKKGYDFVCHEDDYFIDWENIETEY